MNTKEAFDWGVLVISVLAIGNGIFWLGYSLGIRKCQKIMKEAHIEKPNRD